MFASSTPLIVNHDDRHCPDCGSDQLCSVFRDGGSQVYCRHCKNKRWPNRHNDKGRDLYDRMVWP